MKAHACGNDFLIVEESVAAKRHAEVTQALCARHTGVGADGIEFLDRKPARNQAGNPACNPAGNPAGNPARRADGSLFLRLFNADGSEAELSGNGTRCVAAWLAESEGREQVELGTHGGVRTCRVVRREGAQWWIESGMGVPRVMPRKIEIDGVPGVIEGAMVHVGNPHFVIFTEAEDFGTNGMSWQEVGAKISVDPMFRHGTNVEFVRVLAPDRIAFRIFERGCGPTMSSGTGTCASSAASMVVGGLERALTAVAEGGPQRVVWERNESEMLLTGPAEIICKGSARFDEKGMGTSSGAF